MPSRSKSPVKTPPGRPSAPKDTKATPRGARIPEDRVQALLETAVGQLGSLLEGQVSLQQGQREIRLTLENVDGRISTLEVRVLALRKELSNMHGELDLLERGLRGLEELRHRQKDLEQRLSALESAA